MFQIAEIANEHTKRRRKIKKIEEYYGQNGEEKVEMKENVAKKRKRMRTRKQMRKRRETGEETRKREGKMGENEQEKEN
jgi:hypothetical protein